MPETGGFEAITELRPMVAHNSPSGVG